MSLSDAFNDPEAQRMATEHEPGIRPAAVASPTLEHLAAALADGPSASKRWPQQPHDFEAHGRYLYCRACGRQNPRTEYCEWADPFANIERELHGLRRVRDAVGKAVGWKDGGLPEAVATVVGDLAASREEIRILTHKLAGAHQALRNQARNYLGRFPPSDLDVLMANTKIRSKARKAAAVAELGQLRAAAADRRTLTEPQPRSEYHEDFGSVLWWKLPVSEAPYAGTTLDDDFPDYVTHWTRIPEITEGGK